MKLKNQIKFFMLIKLISVSAFAGFDLSQLSYLNGKAGVGLNPYEKGLFKCVVSIDQESNSLSIRQADAYASEAVFVGNLVKSSKKMTSGLVLETAKADLQFSGLCGDHASAKSVIETLRVDQNKVSTTISYRCGLFSKRYTHTYTCNLN